MTYQKNSDYSLIFKTTVIMKITETLKVVAIHHLINSNPAHTHTHIVNKIMKETENEASEKEKNQKNHFNIDIIACNEID